MIEAAAPSPADLAVSETLSAVVPYRNLEALFGYYFAVFGFIPVVGLPFAAGGAILGLAGLIRRHREPRARGLLHALFGVVAGGGVTALYGLLAALIVFGA